jgi:hypothetical protein
MKNLLFGGIYGIPTAALLILVSLLAAFGLQQLGVDPTVYKLVGGIGTLVGVVAFVIGVARSK